MSSTNFYIAGVTPDQIYLTEYNHPSEILVCNADLSSIHHFKIPVTGEERNIHIRIDSPFVYAVNSANTTITIYKMKHDELSKYRTNNLHTMNFDLVAAVSPGSFILRAADSNKYFLAKYINGADPKKVNVLEKQLDGFLCEDGILEFDPHLSRAFYLYYYRNQFICFDSNLNLLYKNNTIDTNVHVKLTVAQSGSIAFNTMSSPTKAINEKLCITSKFLLIESLLLGDNEDRLYFTKSSAIDAYNINDGKYQFSFYMSDFDNSKIREFKLLNKKTLVALQGEYILIYPVGINL
ncbi:MAG TPA: hypothetical protein VK787_14130 [Puia sp.]|nr:hypothetical protein [Puia sp.]